MYSTSVETRFKEIPLIIVRADHLKSGQQPAYNSEDDKYV
jgi:hypothetical protein